MFTLLLLNAAATIAGLDIQTVYALIAAAVWGVVYGVRRLLPGLWAFVTRCNPKFEMLPAMVLSALSTAAVTDWHGILGALQQVAIGLLLSLIPIGFHHVAKEAPGPYRGQVGGGKPAGT